MVTPAGERYSLWLMPTGEVCDRLSGIIRELSATYGAPEFPPHVTLLGSCTGSRWEVVRKSAEVAAAIRHFGIRLGEIDFLDEYFRCLFVHAALTEPLRKAHQTAVQAFERKRESDFMPHLSLLYGELSGTVKDLLTIHLGKRVDLEFKVRKLHLFRTQGEPSKWRRVASFGLK